MIWKSISFYCNISNWNLLLVKIKQFSDLHTGMITSYQINLHYIAEHNIILYLLVSDKEKDSLDDIINVFFRDFIESLTVTHPFDQSTGNTYSQNFIQFGQDGLSYSDDSFTNHKYLFQKNISDILIEALKDEPFDKDTILVLAFYWHLILIKIFYVFFNSASDELLYPYHNDFLKQPLELRRLHRISKKNINSFYSITNEIFLYNNITKESMGWGDSLMQLFSNYIDSNLSFYKNSSKSYEYNIQNLQQDLMDFINRHLGVEYSSHTFLYYIIPLVTTMQFKGLLIEQFPTLSMVKREMIKKHNQRVKEISSFCKKMDDIVIPKGENELRLFVIARNESLRLPYFLEYYTNLGVDRIFFIDNNSTDGSREIALSFKNVHVFKIEKSYKDHWYWMEYFLNKYGKNRWCLVVDIDELFHFPYFEHLKLSNLIEYLTNNNFTALRSILLDFHSDKAITDTVCKSNSNPIDICPFFDPSYIKNHHLFFDKKRWCHFESETYAGGVRTKFFKDNEDYWFNITKFSLFKYTKKTYLSQGMHGINGANIADIEGVVVHTKFMYDFKSRVHEESKREEHFNNAKEYKIYNNSINNEKFLCLKNEKSVKYGGTKQFLKFGVMKCSQKYIDMFNLQIDICHNINTLDVCNNGG